MRLAWELLRRMPRYRRKYRKLEELGIKTATFFKPSSSSFYSGDNPPGLPDWANLPLRGHKGEPPTAFQDDTFGTYIEAQSAAGQPWFVMNRRKWVMDPCLPGSSASRPGIAAMPCWPATSGRSRSGRFRRFCSLCSCGGVESQPKKPDRTATLRTFRSGGWSLTSQTPHHQPSASKAHGGGLRVCPQTIAQVTINLPFP